MGEMGSVLPRGPQALPKEVVLANQCERLLAATPVVLAERGYSQLTVHDVISRAGVSRRTFYQLFKNKMECVLVAHEAALGRVCEVIGQSCSPERSWPEAVAVAVGRVLELAAEAPAEVRLALLSSQGALEPELVAPALAGQERLARFLREERGRGEAQASGELIEDALVGAVTAIVSARLSSGDVEGLRALAPELVQLILAPYLGYEEAQRFAQAA